MKENAGIIQTLVEKANEAERKLKEQRTCIRS